jgi:2-dehydro-3-deoxyphosphooctonate aldolase (KDO 8-P synthase)
MSRLCSIHGPSGVIECGAGKPLTVIAGPCVLEGHELSMQIGTHVRDLCARLGLSYVFKASFDKANRTSGGSPRGPGLDGLAQLAAVREALDVPVTTDVHEPAQAMRVAEVVDVLQIPAFLCRQTDLLVACAEAAARYGRVVNIKKGQFLSPREMRGPVRKVRAAGCDEVMVTERGTFFGYHRLVNDFAGVGDLLDFRASIDEAAERAPAVCFDCTHSVQLPGAGEVTGGRRDRIPMLARAAAGVGVDAVFLECHPEPEGAPSDGANMLPLPEVGPVLESVARIAEIGR